jgi:enoyl-CoA hydratase/carnithine racemase
MSDDTKPLLRADRDGLCTLTLNRPDQLNALNLAIFQALEAHIADIAAKTDSIGCVVIRANGRSFSAGADLKDIAAQGANMSPTYKAKVLEKLEALPQPTIAAVHGHCFTGGLEVAVCCDFIFAAETTRFADTHGKWGLVAGWGLLQRLPRRIGIAKTKEMGMTARHYTARQAEAMGLTNMVVADDQYDAELDRFVKDILANSWHTNRSNKKLLADTEGMSQPHGLAYESYHHPGRAPDYAERVAKFVKKQ